MRTTNNFTVESLVTKYRNYVSKHCPTSKQALNDWIDEDGKIHFEDWVNIPIQPDSNADEQLLVVVYSAVAGNDVDSKIVEALSIYADKFYKDALSEEEFSFLCSNFKEFVSYEFSHMKEWSWHDCRMEDFSDEKTKLIKEYIHPQEGSSVYIADALYCGLAVQFPGCIIQGFTGDIFDHEIVWALGQIRMYAAEIQSEIVSGEGDCDNYSYNLPPKGSVDYLIYDSDEWVYFLQKKNYWRRMCTEVEALYDLLKPGGKMIFFSNRKEYLACTEGNHFLEYRRRLVEEKAIEAIVAFKDKHSFFGDQSIMLVISKSPKGKFLVKDETTSYTNEFDIEELDAEVLWPSYYAAQRPNNGVHLTDIVSLKKKGKDYIIDEEHIVDKVDHPLVILEKYKGMPVIDPSDLAKEYKKTNLNITDLRLASDAYFKDSLLDIRTIDEPCVLLYGKEETYVVGYVREMPEGGLATMKSVICLSPKEGVDVRYVAALLLLPEVKEQIRTICNNEVVEDTLKMIFDKVIVPNHTDKERWAFLAEENYNALIATQEDKKKDAEYYIKAVRMRKHALTQSLSSIESTLYALNVYRERQNGTLSDNDCISRVKRTTVKDAFEYLSKAMKDMLIKLDHIADVEYSFSEPEWIDPEKFIENYIREKGNGWVNFKGGITWSKGHNQAERDIRDPKTGEITIRKGDSLKKMMFPKDALKQVFDNIVSNAISHGFNDSSRDDYLLKFSWKTDGLALIICIENNGTPIPSDRDTASLLEYGVSTSLSSSGHHGIGCNEIEGIMRKYNGKVELISSPDSKFKVKYVLTFNRYYEKRI
jgi:hypothetical protein